MQLYINDDDSFYFLFTPEEIQLGIHILLGFKTDHVEAEKNVLKAIELLQEAQARQDPHYVDNIVRFKPKE
jgi:hypothetical protein